MERINSAAEKRAFIRLAFPSLALDPYEDSILCVLKNQALRPSLQAPSQSLLSQPAPPKILECGGKETRDGQGSNKGHRAQHCACSGSLPSHFLCSLYSLDSTIFSDSSLQKRMPNYCIWEAVKEMFIVLSFAIQLGDVAKVGLNSGK